MAQDAVTVVPAGEGDLAVAAAFATGADSTKILPPARADSTDGEGDDDDDDDDDDDATRVKAHDANAANAAENPEFEFSDGDDETTTTTTGGRARRRAIPDVIRDGDDSSEWESSDDESVEELDLENMPKWLQDIKDGVDTRGGGGGGGGGGGDDFDGDDDGDSVPPRTLNEVAPDATPAPAPPPPIDPDEAVAHVGDVVSVVGDTIVVQSLPGIEYLDEESVLCLSDRVALGAVEEVFGPVAAPLYALRVPRRRRETRAENGSGSGSGCGNETAAAAAAAAKAKESGATEDKDDGATDAKDGGDDEAHKTTNTNTTAAIEVKVGARVYVVEGRRRRLTTAGLYRKGYDNSGKNDEEISDDDEFSDDEKEAEAKKKRRQRKRGIDGEERPADRRVADGGLAAAAAAAGAGAGLGGGRGGQRGGGPPPRARAFQPNAPPAMQMAHMSGIGAGGNVGAGHPAHTTRGPPPPMAPFHHPQMMMPVRPGQTVMHNGQPMMMVPVPVMMNPQMMARPPPPGQQQFHRPPPPPPPPPRPPPR